MNSHDEIKKLIDNSRRLLSTTSDIKEINEIKKRYGLISEQTEDNDVTTKLNVTQDIEDKIEDDTESDSDFDVLDSNENTTSSDKSQGYRVLGGIIVLHGKTNNDVELTTDEKMAFQETMNEFVEQVSDLVDFNKLNVYPNNVEWSGKIIDFDLDFFFTIGEENGVYINGDMIKADDGFLEMMNKLKVYYEKFKSKWAKVLASRRRTEPTND